MIKLVTQNPYRLLGVFSNSPTKEKVANMNKLKAFIKVGRSISFPLDLDGLLPTVSRTEDSIAAADSKLTLPADQLKHAQFWFLKEGPFDEVAFNHLFAGDMAKAVEIWSKKDSVSSLQNRVVCALIKDDYSTACSCAEKLYSQFAESFVSAVAGDTVKGGNLGHDFLDSLAGEGGASKLLPHITNNDWRQHLRSAAVAPVINGIQAAIDTAKASRGKGSAARYNAGVKLMNDTKILLTQLNQLLPKSDMQYQMVVDKLANEILQCGIEYYNESKDTDKARKAFILQDYALNIAVGQMTRDRCQDNVNILKEVIESLPPKEFETIARHIDNIIHNSLLSNKPENVIKLIQSCGPYLADIRDVEGKTGKFYLRMSSHVAETALGAIIGIVNSAIKDIEKPKRTDDSLFSRIISQDPYLGDFEKRMAIMSLESTLRDAWNVMAYIEVLDMKLSTEMRFHEQKKSLKSLIDQLNVFTYNAPINFRLQSHAEREKFLSTISNCSSFKEAVSLLSSCVDDEILSILDDKCFELCHKKSDFKKYVKAFGSGAKHKLAAENHFQFDLRAKKFWNYIVDNKGMIIFSVIVVAIIIGTGVIGGIKGYSVLLWVIGGFFGLGALGSLEDDWKTAIICAPIAAVLIFGAIKLGDYADHSIVKEESEFMKIQSSPSIEGCDSFLRNFPNSEKKDRVLEINYNCALEDGLSSLNLFAKKYDGSEWGRKASEKVRQICDSLYQIADRTNTTQGWRDYQAAVPPDYYADSNDKIVSIENAAWSSESEAWKMAQKENTISAYQKYLDLFPRGAHRAAADKKIIDMQVANVYAGEHGTLPSMDQTGYGGGPTSSVSIQNSTQYTLTLLYSGPDSKRVVISPSETGHVTLKNGTYRVAASVSAAGVSNFAGSESLRGGSYSVEYYITSY